MTTRLRLLAGGAGGGRLLGLFGLHTSEDSAQRNGYQFSVRYPAVARAGLDIVWQTEVKHPGGFGKQITSG